MMAFEHCCETVIKSNNLFAVMNRNCDPVHVINIPWHNDSLKRENIDLIVKLAMWHESNHYAYLLNPEIAHIDWPIRLERGTWWMSGYNA